MESVCLCELRALGSAEVSAECCRFVADEATASACHHDDDPHDHTSPEASDSRGYC